MLTVLILPIAAFVFALLSIMAMVMVAAISSRWPGRLFSYLMWLILIASVGTILFSERVLRMDYYGLVVDSEGDTGSHMLSKLLLAAVIGCSVALCAAWIFTFKKNKTGNNRFYQRGLQAPTDIVTSFMVFYVAFSILPIFFGQRYAFHISLVYPFFVFLALFLWVQRSNIDPAVILKQCLSVLVVGSLIAGVAAPQLAVQPGYIGLIPGFSSRLWGITSHANGLGSVACLLFILEAAEPTKRAWLSRCILLAAAAAMILAQSKTSIVAAFIGFSIIFVWRFLLQAQAKSEDGRHKENLVIISALGSLMAFTAIFGAWVIFSETSILDALARRLEGRALDDLSTGAGRTLIWSVAIQGGMENPLFGQGSEFWSLENRLRWGLSGAVHAHNLFLQVFSRSGFVGLATLLLFLYFLSQYAVRASGVTRGASIAILTVFFMRAMSEVPISPNSILGSEFFAMMACFIYLIDRGGRPVPKLRKRGVMRRPINNLITDN
ncbi:MAG TPA: O-antigen ligase family protein [Nitrosospira sp.]|nr:O-antigen ligase family protein [Nitrosospira sp.]